MKTVNSLSGGKTSSYMAYHYPADVELFALVTVESKLCQPKDKGLVKMVSDKIGREFIGTAESDKTIKVMFDLEQMIGREIVWVVGDAFEEVIRKKSHYLPNQVARFCTTKMKMEPIFWHCQNHVGKIVDMRVGFRVDESDRADRNKHNTSLKVVTGKGKTGRNKWQEIEWRRLSFPLIENGIDHLDVVNWVNSTNLDFPADSNCVGCFWKPLQQLRRNWDDEPTKMQWFSDMESNTGNQWKKESNYESIKRLGLQEDFFFGTGAGCQAGFCTD